MKLLNIDVQTGKTDEIELTAEEAVMIQREVSANPSDFDVLGRRMVEQELLLLESKKTNELLGRQVVDFDLRLLLGGL